MIHDTMKSTPFLSRLYILNGHEPVRCESVTRWAEWFETAERVIGYEWVGPAQVSTVFLGFDGHVVAEQPPLLFETVVHSGCLKGMMYRWSSWKEAEEGHARTVGEVEVAEGLARDEAEGAPEGAPIH